MKSKCVDELIALYKNSKSLKAYEELMSRFMRGTLDDEQQYKIYSVLPEAFIKQLVIRYGSRKTLIDILCVEKDCLINNQIREKLKKLELQEAKILLESDDIDCNTRKFAIKYADATTLIEYLKRINYVLFEKYRILSAVDTLLQEEMECVIERFKELDIDTAIADELVFFVQASNILDFAIEKASNMALINFLYEKKEERVSNPTRVYHILMKAELTTQEAKFIMDNIKNDTLIICAIKYASKDDVLNFYSTQTNVEVMEECLNRLEEFMK